MFGTSFKQHFAAKELSITYNDPTVFIISQWQYDKTKPSILYLLYRTAAALILIVTWLLTMIISEDSVRWPIYLTNWGYTVCTLQALLGVIILSISWKSMKPPAKLHPIYWLIHTIATPLAFGITVMYWTVIYKPGVAVTTLNVFVHGINSALMFCDLWVVSHPVRVLQLVYPLALGLTYTVFSVIYYHAGGTGRESPYIYPILKWDEPLKTTFICVGVMVFVVALHLFVYFVYRIRLRVAEYVFRHKKPIPKEQPKGYDNAAMAMEKV